MRAPVVAAACLAAALPAACGSSRDRAQRPPMAHGPPITIWAPADGQRLKAGRTRRGLLRARARVRGRTRAGGVVFLAAGCHPRPCRGQARAGADGRWAATLTLVVPRAQRFVTIDASAQRDVVAAGAAVATVELVGPVRARASATMPAPGRSSRADARRAAAAAPARRRLARDVLVIGDSLAEGMAASLRAALRGWRVRIDARIGRPLDEGMGIFGEQSSPPPILAFSLFTNDDPRNTRALGAAVRSTAERPGSCAVWATIVRPPVNGVSYAAANTLLRGLASELAPSLELVDWAAAVTRSPSLLSFDEVHASPRGYRALALMYAAAIRSCAGEG